MFFAPARCVEDVAPYGSIYCDSYSKTDRHGFRGGGVYPYYNK